MTSVFGGVGRPTDEESERRRREFLRLVASGAELDEAAREARIKPERALRLLSAPEVLEVAVRARAAAA